MADYSLPFKALNAQGAMELYAQRTYYKETTEDIFDPLPNFVDLWYKTPYYGKADLKGNLVIVKPNSLKFSMGRDVRLLNFVFDAFEDFQKYLNHATKRGRVELSNTLFGGMAAKKSYISPLDAYFDYGANILEEFNKYLATSTKIIATLPTYMIEFLDFLSQVTNIFTFSSYYASNVAGINATGLAVDLWDADASSDFEKNKIFRDEEFYNYAQAAANFGFRIDKNVPWRLVADLKSKPMEKYRLKYNISSINAMFNGLYTSSDFYDLYATGALIFMGYQKYQRERQFNFKTWHCFKADFQLKAAVMADVVSKTKEITFETLTTWNFYSTYLNTMYVRALERMKNMESGGRYLPDYNLFKKRFENALSLTTPNSAAQSATAALEILYDYYNPTKIYAAVDLETPYYLGGRPQRRPKVLTFKQNIGTMYKTQIGIPGPENLNLTKI